MIKLKTIISGIKALSLENETILSKRSSFEYKNISTDLELKKTFKNCDVFWFRLNHKLTKSILANAKCRRRD